MVRAEAITDLEAVRSVLGALRVPREIGAHGELPSPEIEWPILVTFDAPVSSSGVLAAFGDAWWDEHDAALYVLPPDGVWMRAADPAPSERWQAIQVAARLPGDAEPRSVRRLEQMLADVKRSAAELGALLTEPRYPIESAVVRAEELRRLRDFIEQCDDGCVHLCVDNAQGYRAHDVESVLAEIGFHARRGGLFALVNGGDCIGDELILGATLQESTRLALWFAVPRVAEPFGVLDAMVAVASWVVHSLGGSIVDERGERANLLLLRANVADLVQRLNAAHLVPGATGMALV